jgi:hypothetical protein
MACSMLDTNACAAGLFLSEMYTSISLRRALIYSRVKHQTPIHPFFREMNIVCLASESIYFSLYWYAVNKCLSIDIHSFIIILMQIGEKVAT